MKIYVISFTRNGKQLSEKMKLCLNEHDVIVFYKPEIAESTAEWTKNAFHSSDAIIFIGACGIAVRSINGLLQGKTKDPAVVVCDEKGKFAIPILSGHIGGANALAEEIAAAMGAQPIITTATDINGVWSVDTWALKMGFSIADAKNIKYISSELLNGGKIGIVSKVDLNCDFPENVLYGNKETKYGVCVSPFYENIYEKTLHIVPKCVVIGVGSRKSAPENALIELYEDIKKSYALIDESILCVATIDLKREEKAILKFCEYIGAELVCFGADELNSLEGDFEGSDFVKQTTGTDNVCERSAVLSSKGELIIRKTKGNSVTIAAAICKTNLERVNTK